MVDFILWVVLILCSIASLIWAAVVYVLLRIVFEVVRKKLVVI